MSKLEAEDKRSSVDCFLGFLKSQFMPHNSRDFDRKLFCPTIEDDKLLVGCTIASHETDLLKAYNGDQMSAHIQSFLAINRELINQTNEKSLQHQVIFWLLVQPTQKFGHFMQRYMVDEMEQEELSTCDSVTADVLDAVCQQVVAPVDQRYMQSTHQQFQTFLLPHEFEKFFQIHEDASDKPSFVLDARSGQMLVDLDKVDKMKLYKMTAYSYGLILRLAKKKRGNDAEL